MSKKFSEHWDRSGSEPLLTRVKEKIHHGPPLKERLSNTLYRLQVIQHKLGDTSLRLEQKDKDFFNKCSEAQLIKNPERAAIYANECAEIRKMARVVLHSQMAIEQVTLRLETIRDFGDVAAQMSPVVSIVHAVKNHLTGIMPQVSYELGAIGETLNGLVIEVGETMGTGYDMVASGEEAQKILKEAGIVAEQRMTEKFPELPTTPTLPAGKEATPRS